LKNGKHHLLTLPFFAVKGTAQPSPNYYRKMPKSILLFLLFSVTAFSQKYTHSDSLKGTYGPARSWWDIVHYDLHVAFNPEDSTINGHNTITWKALRSGAELQVDLMQPLSVDTILLGARPALTAAMATPIL
jgi:hypothetical protein